MSSDSNSIIGTWNIKLSDKKGELIVKAVDQQGKINGSVFGNDIKRGSFDPKNLQINFETQTPEPSPEANQIYVGHLYHIVVETPVLAGVYYTSPLVVGKEVVSWLADKF
jgi:hypothetical protein